MGRWSVPLAAFVGAIAAVALMYWLIRRSAATGFASLFYLVPPCTALMAFFAFGERLTATSMVGMELTVVGVAMVVRA